MDKLIGKYLDDCLASDSEIINKILVLRKRGYSLDVSDDNSLGINPFAWNLDKVDLIKLFHAPLDDVIEKLFSKDGTDNFEVCYQYSRKWGVWFGSSLLYGDKVRICGLEPFVARLVRSLALCGIFTFYSCDGWHSNSQQNGKLFVAFKDRYSLLWLRTLLNSDEELKKIELNYTASDSEFSIRLEKDRWLDAYSKVDSVAEILYRKRLYFNKSKILVKNMYKGLPKSNRSNEELLNMFREGFEQQKIIAHTCVDYRTKEQEQKKWNSLNDNTISAFADEFLRIENLKGVCDDNK